ncbi:dynein light chain roadblock-type 1 isoform X1 [Alexandromys fortis]|uniref:dynein light chain roadblock-type 1 isoform X1 n=1 Tax=Alexandromys fortis TaxID=100897 RepID=UPI002153933B|nr:dynein light chain roadblock-type 1 isoform X1 [Microtus fortis]
MAEVEETLKRLQSQKGVQGIIVVNTEGIPIKSTMDNPTTTQYANLMHNFILKARSTVREIDPQNDLTFLRIRSKKNEIMVAPESDTSAAADLCLCYHPRGHVCWSGSCTHMDIYSPAL